MGTKIAGSSAQLFAGTGNTDDTTICAVCMAEFWDGAKLPCSHKLCVECCNALFASAEGEGGDQGMNETMSSECVCRGVRNCSTPRSPFCRRHVQSPAPKQWTGVSYTVSSFPTATVKIRGGQRLKTEERTRTPAVMRAEVGMAEATYRPGHYRTTIGRTLKVVFLGTRSVSNTRN